MSSKSSKSMSVQRQREKTPPRKQDKKESRQDPDSHKLFLTNLNGQYTEQQVENQVRRFFEKYGEVKKLSLKKHKNGYYYFGFLQYPKGFQAYDAIKALDQHPLFGKNMKVRQDRQSEGCFYCKRMGHFARQCPENRDRRRSRSNERRSRQRYDRRRDERHGGHDRYERRDDRGRDFRDRDRQRERERYGRGDRYQRQRENERDRHRHQRRRHRSRSYSDSKSSSESSYRRNDRKEKKDRKRRSRS